MTDPKSRYLAVAILLVATTLVVSVLQYDSSQNKGIDSAALQSIPMQFGKWIGEDSPLDEKVYEILETRAIIHRSYRNSNGDDVFLSIVHYNDAKVDFHAPEACIGGGGMEAIKIAKTVTLSYGTERRNIELAELVTTRTSGQTLTYYFFKAGKFVGSNYIKMRLGIAANKLVKNDTSGSLIRISTTLIPGKKEMAESTLLTFIEDIFPVVQRNL